MPGPRREAHREVTGVCRAGVHFRSCSGSSWLGLDHPSLVSTEAGKKQLHCGQEGAHWGGAGSGAEVF